MKWMVGLIMAAAFAGCGEQTNKGPELQENTEEYFKAHGIVQGQPNELRIGGTLFRFPAGVGLNPYTAQEVYRTKDGSPMTLSSKECLEQGKCEKVATPIVKGRADKVTLFLDVERSFLPQSKAFGSRGTGSMVSVQISSSPNNRQTQDKIATQRAILRNQQELQELGLVEYVFADRKNPGDAHLLYLAKNITAPLGDRLIIDCEPQYDSKKEGFVDLPAFCTVTYQTSPGIMVVYGFDGEILLSQWLEIHHAVTHFIDSVVVKK